MDDTKPQTAENLCGHSGGGGGGVRGGICSNPPAPPAPAAPAPTTATPAAAAPLELHVCMGLNACKGHDRFGTNSCAGTGYCATAAVHHCRTLNNCRGQGGCGLFGTAEDDATPGANECAWQGACATPIQAERFSTQGENKGKSVWVLARKLFEERMRKAKRSFGPSPNPCGPPQAWLEQTVPGGYDSCGSAGDKYCSFGFNDPAKDAKELCERSLHPVICGGPKQTEAAHCGTAEKGGGEANACGADNRTDGGPVAPTES
ncbi:MAG TPA: hypothetical protein VER08_12320 [Pyrinomonadaceae bacterium]|nr:hypothetical protein [Pyrinomonadaceae bacterium]